MLDTIYEALIADELIRESAKGGIKYYKYPEVKDIKETHIIIDPIDVPKPGDYADDEWLTDDYMLQIDIWSKDMYEKELVANLIRKIMWSIGFRQLPGGMDEYDNEYDIFRDARRYRGKVYRKDLANL